jgi:hypothetical protein
MKIFLRCLVPVLAGILALSPPVAAEEDRVSELERKVDALTREIEQLNLGAAADTTHVAASGVSIGGYGEMLYENFDRKREDGAPSGRLDRVDFLRQVFQVGYRFSEELLFNSAVELEHAGGRDEAPVEGKADPVTGDVTGSAELSGRSVLEFAYVEWSRNPAFGVRTGLLLVPVGLLNELHEPPAFIGARRSDVERFVLPTTWSAAGVGLYGETGRGIEYRLSLTEGLDAARFNAGGIREGRQNGSQSLITQPAVTARLDYSGAPGAVIGASLHTGNTWQNFQPGSGTLAPRLTLVDVHGRLAWRGFEMRALYAYGSLTEAGALSDQLGLTGSERLGERFFGAYLEAAYDVMPRLCHGTRWALQPYARWEALDTQENVPGGSENPALARTILTAGAALLPHPNVVVKADRQWRSNDADTETGQWNLALGYVF